MAAIVALAASYSTAQSPEDARPERGRDTRFAFGPAASLSQILGRPTEQSVTLSVLSDKDIEAYIEYGTASGNYSRKTDKVSALTNQPVEIAINSLRPNTRHFYRLCTRQPGQDAFEKGVEYSFHTQRTPGQAFTFALQGDSHPERLGRMYHPGLYSQTMQNVEKDQPDFYLTMGDDFSLDRLVNNDDLSQGQVDDVYAHQRSYLGVVGRSSPLFLMNGNHEQAGMNWLDGTPNNPAVMAAKARVRFYPLPEPDAFYTGNTEELEFVGLLRDYYAWTWGDALFVVLDAYWHSPVAVDSAQDRGGDRRERSGNRERADASDRGARDGGGQRGGGQGGGQGGGRGGQGGGRERDWWGMSIGDAQYQWFRKTLEESTAKYKFVFCHHVMGTGRGGVELAPFYEWGGKDRDGTWLFNEKRPNWELPIHQLMVKHGVTIFFQGHDHLFARQELDGVIYQSMPNPADDTYQAFNREAYLTGDILPNSGHLRVTVSPEDVRVDYVRAFKPEDKADGNVNGEVAFSYTIKP